MLNKYDCLVLRLSFCMKKNADNLKGDIVPLAIVSDGWGESCIDRFMMKNTFGGIFNKKNFPIQFNIDDTDILLLQLTIITINSENLIKIINYNPVHCNWQGDTTLRQVRILYNVFYYTCKICFCIDYLSIDNESDLINYGDFFAWW